MTLQLLEAVHLTFEVLVVLAFAYLYLKQTKAKDEIYIEMQTMIDDFTDVRNKIISNAQEMMLSTFNSEQEKFEEGMSRIRSHVEERFDGVKEDLQHLTKEAQKAGDLDRQLAMLRNEVRRLNEEIRKQDAIIQRRDRKINKLREKRS